MIPDFLNSETFTTGTGAACIGVIKMKAFAIQPVGKIKSRVDQVQKAFEILSNISTEYHRVLFYPAEAAASSMMELFKYPKQA